MAFATGQVLDAADLNGLETYEARYERQSGTQAVANTTDTQVQFPTAVRTHTAVVASGTNNNAFTLGPGVWIVEVGLRWASSAASAEVSIAAGSVTWSSANVKAVGASGINTNCVATIYVAPATTVAVTVNAYQASGGSINLTFFGGATHIAFTRSGLRA